MGNTTSHTKSKNLLPTVIDYIASNYILSQNFKDMKNLSETKYCDNLVILTSDIIAQKLNEEEVKFLSHRIKN